MTEWGWVSLVTSEVGYERRGPGLELAPLAGIFASSVPPDFRPLLRRPAGKAFDLQPGKTTLDPVPSPRLPPRAAAPLLTTCPPQMSRAGPKNVVMLEKGREQHMSCR